MTDIDTLRRAAARMRELAEAATSGPWSRSGDDLWMVGNATLTGLTASHDVTADAGHIAAWHPDVALAVAEWLDGAAKTCDDLGLEVPDVVRTVARVFLGEDS